MSMLQTFKLAWALIVGGILWKMTEPGIGIAAFIILFFLDGDKETSC